jgi:cytoskeletal protein RodZ
VGNDAARGTEAALPQGATVAGSSTAARPWFKKKRVLIPAGLAGVIILGSALGAGGSEPPTTPTALEASASSSASRTTAAAPSATPTPSTPPSAATTSAPAKPAAPKPAAPKPAAPKLTIAQENAVGTAESYLDYSGFSKKGLIKQLEFEGYKAKDITAALATMKVDWNAEAAESARSYVDYSHFSRNGLIKQLKFEGYTSKQAVHGADSVGL